MLLQMLESFGTNEGEGGLTLKGLEEIYELDGNVDTDFTALGLTLVSLRHSSMAIRQLLAVPTHQVTRR